MSIFQCAVPSNRTAETMLRSLFEIVKDSQKSTIKIPSDWVAGAHKSASTKENREREQEGTESARERENNTVNKTE